MITVNANLKNAITGTGTQLVRLTGHCYDTSNVYHSISWTNADIVQDSFFVDKRCVSGSQFSLGNTVSNELGFEIFSAGYEDWLLEGVELKVELGGYVSGVATYFEVGKFILEKPTMGTDRLIIKGYDKLTLFDTLADNWVMKTGGGENVLGNAVRITSSYPMGKDGWMSLCAGTAISPYWNASMTSCLTGLVPFSENGRFPQKIIVSGLDITGADSYYVLFYYNAGVLTNVGGLMWLFNYLATVTQIGTNIYEVSFNPGVDPNKTALQEYIESNYGVHDYFATFTLSNGVFQNPSSLEIKYNAAAALPIEDTINDICDACGMQFFDGYPSPYNLSMSYRPLADYSKYTYRSILGLFAKACGGNLTLWPSGYGLYMGQLRIAVPTSTGVTLTESEVLSCDLVNEEVVLSGTRYVDSNGALYINRTENTPPYKFLDFSDCPVFPIASQTAVDNLSALTGSANSWLPGKAKILAMPWLEPMDIVSFNYSIKPYYSGKFLVTRVHITANGATTIESAGFTESTTNSSGYTGVSYSNDANPDYDAVFSTAASQTPGTTTNVALSTFPYNLPKVNDYVYADGGMGIVTAIDGSFATVNWLTNYTGSPQPHTHPLQEVYSDSGDKTAIASGDALIFTDVSDSGKLKQMVDDFDTSNTTDFLRRDGTWATPAGGGGSTDEIPFLLCSTAAATAAKTVSYTGFTLTDYKRVYVQFTNGNTANQPTLNVNGTGAKSILYAGQALRANVRDYNNGCYIPAATTLELVYYNSYWRIIGGWESGVPALNGYGNRLSNGNRSSQIPKLEYFLATSAMSTGKPTAGDSKVLQFNWDNNTKYASQLAIGNQDSRNVNREFGWVQIRSQDWTNIDGWTDWIDVALVREGTFTLSFNSIDETWNYIKIGRHVTIWGPSDAWATEIITGLSSFTGLPFAPKFGTMVHIPIDYTQLNVDGYFVAKLNTDKTMNFQTLRVNSGGALVINTAMGYYLQYATPYTPITYITDD